MQLTIIAMMIIMLDRRILGPQLPRLQLMSTILLIHKVHHHVAYTSTRTFHDKFVKQNRAYLVPIWPGLS